MLMLDLCIETFMLMLDLCIVFMLMLDVCFETCMFDARSLY